LEGVKIRLLGSCSLEEANVSSKRRTIFEQTENKAKVGKHIGYCPPSPGKRKAVLPGFVEPV
jgi:hypothetical protein